jgi:hypothetical protein
MCGDVLVLALNVSVVSARRRSLHRSVILLKAVFMFHVTDAVRAGSYSVSSVDRCDVKDTLDA